MDSPFALRFTWHPHLMLSACNLNYVVDYDYYWIWPNKEKAEYVRLASSHIQNIYFLTQRSFHTMITFTVDLFLFSVLWHQHQ